MKRIVLGLCAMSVFALGVNQAAGQNLLTGGTFEVPGGELPFWDIDEFYTNNIAAVDAASVATFTDKAQTPPKSLWMRAFAGAAPASAGGDPTKFLTNAVLSQTVDAIAGVTYNFKGWSLFEANFSGGVDTLNASSPLGAVTSPTVTEMMIEYLDGSSNPIGAPFTIDVKADRLAQIGFPLINDNNYYQHLVTGLAPAGTMQARVTMGAYDMVRNGTGVTAGTGPQSAFADSFSFTAAATPATELLQNASLETNPPSPLDGWTVVNTDPGNPANIEVIRAYNEGPANHTPGGTTGIWLSAFFGEPATPVDGSISKIVPGTPGEDYSFSAWSKLEANYTASSTYLQVAFLDAAQSVIGSPITLDVITAGQLNDDTWRQFSIDGTAPVGTAFVRVLAGLEDGILGTANPQGGFFDDFVLEIADAGQPGDFDGDGDVDGRDFLAWQRGDSPGGVGDAGDLVDWQTNYGTGGGLTAISAVPEPASSALFMSALALAGLCRGKRNA